MASSDGSGIPLTAGHVTLAVQCITSMIGVRYTLCNQRKPFTVMVTAVGHGDSCCSGWHRARKL
jgi:hypothetical protein